MAGERRRTGRRGSTVIHDPFAALRLATAQQIEEHHQRWARMSRGAPAAAPPVRRPTFQLVIRPGDDGVDDDVDDDAYVNGGFGAVPASGEAIAALPEAAAGETREEECAVCLEGFGEGERLRKMPCPDSHGFHDRCIVEWLKASRLCPLCRFALPPADEEEEETDTESDAQTEAAAEEEEVDACGSLSSLFLM